MSETRLKEVQTAMAPFMEQARAGLHSRASVLYQLELLLTAAEEIDGDGFARGYDQATIDEASK